MFLRRENEEQWQKLDKALDKKFFSKHYLVTGDKLRTIPEENLTKVVRRQGDKYVLYSKDGSKKLGEAKTKEGIEERERQVQYFKHKKFAKRDPQRRFLERTRQFAQEGLKQRLGSLASTPSGRKLVSRTGQIATQQARQYIPRVKKAWFGDSEGHAKAAAVRWAGRVGTGALLAGEKALKLARQYGPSIVSQVKRHGPKALLAAVKSKGILAGAATGALAATLARIKSRDVRERISEEKKKTRATSKSMANGNVEKKKGFPTKEEEKERKKRVLTSTLKTVFSKSIFSLARRYLAGKLVSPKGRKQFAGGLKRLRTGKDPVTAGTARRLKIDPKGFGRATASELTGSKTGARRAGAMLAHGGEQYSARARDLAQRVIRTGKPSPKGVTQIDTAVRERASGVASRVREHQQLGRAIAHRGRLSIRETKKDAASSAVKPREAGKRLKKQAFVQQNQSRPQTLRVNDPGPSYAQPNTRESQNKLIAMNQELINIQSILGEIENKAHQQGLLTEEELEQIVYPLKEETARLLATMQDDEEYRKRPKSEPGPKNQVGDISRELTAPTSNFNQFGSKSVRADDIKKVTATAARVIPRLTSAIARGRKTKVAAIVGAELAGGEAGTRTARHLPKPLGTLVEYGVPEAATDIGMTIGRKLRRVLSRSKKFTKDATRLRVKLLEFAQGKDIKRQGLAPYAHPYKMEKQEGKGWHGDPQGHAEAARVRWAGQARVEKPSVVRKPKVFGEKDISRIKTAVSIVAGIGGGLLLAPLGAGVGAAIGATRAGQVVGTLFGAKAASAIAETIGDYGGDIAGDLIASGLTERAFEYSEKERTTKFIEKADKNVVRYIGRLTSAIIRMTNEQREKFINSLNPKQARLLEIVKQALQRAKAKK